MKKYKTAADIPHADRERMFNTIHAVLKAGQATGIVPAKPLYGQCHLFAHIGAELLRKHYGFMACATTGMAMYSLPKNTFLLFGETDADGWVATRKHWHSWVICAASQENTDDSYLIDFNAGLFPERKIDGVKIWKKLKLKRAIYWEPYTSERDTCFCWDKEVEQQIEQHIGVECPEFVLLMQAACGWYVKPEDGCMKPMVACGQISGRVLKLKQPSKFKLAPNFYRWAA